jgi:hypothetical protein
MIDDDKTARGGLDRVHFTWCKRRRILRITLHFDPDTGLEPFAMEGPPLPPGVGARSIAEQALDAVRRVGLIDDEDVIKMRAALRVCMEEHGELWDTSPEVVQ